MENLTKMIGGVFLTIATIFAMACLSGTILYWIYPHINALFPIAAQHGIIARELNWWDAVCIVWIFTILFKTTVTTTK